MKHESPDQRKALWVALLLILIWGSNFSVQKIVFHEMSPSGFLVARYLLLPLCALIMLMWRYGLNFPKLSRSEMWGLARLGFIGHFLHVVPVTYGIYWSTAFSSSVILACGPIFTLLILRARQLERLGQRQVLGVGVALLGVLLFLSDKLLGGAWRATGGDLVLLGAASLFSYYTVAAKPLIEKHGGLLTMGYATLFGSVPVVLFNAPLSWDVQWSHISWHIWLMFVYASVISAFLGWLLWGWVNAVRGVARTAPLMYLMPPVAGLLAWVFTGESYSGTKIAGAIICLLGVAVAQFSRQTLPISPVGDSTTDPKP
jgi:drug/metabolite transporter (DMT)-like permease